MVIEFDTTCIHELEIVAQQTGETVYRSTVPAGDCLPYDYSIELDPGGDSSATHTWDQTADSGELATSGSYRARVTCLGYPLRYPTSNDAEFEID